jgi:hypothetical protein
MPDGLPYKAATAVPVAAPLHVSVQYSSHYEMEQGIREYIIMRGLIIFNTKQLLSN